jgi:hypothetical protein
MAAAATSPGPAHRRGSGSGWRAQSAGASRWRSWRRRWAPRCPTPTSCRCVGCVPTGPGVRRAACCQLTPTTDLPPQCMPVCLPAGNRACVHARVHAPRSQVFTYLLRPLTRPAAPAAGLSDDGGGGQGSSGPLFPATTELAAAAPDSSSSSSGGSSSSSSGSAAGPGSASHAPGAPPETVVGWELQLVLELCPLVSHPGSGSARWRTAQAQRHHDQHHLRH